MAEEDLHVFCQGTMPAVDAATGQLLLEAPDRLAVSPNGHGGMLAAFAESGAMADAQAPRHPAVVLLPGRQSPRRYRRGRIHRLSHPLRLRR